MNVVIFGITTTSLPPGFVGSHYSYQLSAAGGTAPYRWARTAAFPKGLRLSPSGLISGVPNARAVALGSYPISVHAEDSARGGRHTSTATWTLDLS